ncbi:Uncharacterized conserved protein, DUF2147 family [Palleronia salina]|uniref:Uncharacterized conserved protein, DUF2147 family n=1 Tax=Palleronia salina TaxID=313368 RepID=A0A1M6I3L4_9RHOB|nr:DUF2147 domain-containing protein [Palleronia salina]SHJ29028.1 Uncharacterized conserved protein, DUF2147 family [Palleronia salina]
MKKTILAAIATLGLAGAAHAQDVSGQWRTQADDNGNFALVTISPCGGDYCGVISAAYGPDGRQIQSPNVGRRIVWDMTPQGGGSFTGGKIWAPDRDKTYNSKMQLSGNSLKVEGCVLVVCRGQTWARAN